MVGPYDTSRTQSGTTEYRCRGARCDLRRRLTAGLAIAAGLILGSCAIPFGNGTDSTEQSTQETPRDRNRRYQQEQERMQRQQQFELGGPSDH